MKLKDALNINDLRTMAKRRLPRMVFDYIDGGADDEVTLRHSVRRYDDYQLTWRALCDVTEIDTATRIMGQETRLPFFISPTASTRLFHPSEGELAMARAAEKAGVIYACSTLASQTVEDIAKASSGPKWVQVYVWKDMGIVRNFLARAKDAGFTGCILTVDLPVGGNRERDPRNRFSVPPTPNLSLARQVITKPRWMWDLLTSPKITPANFDHMREHGDQGGVVGFVNQQFSRAVTWKDVEWIREFWGHGFAVKGISRAEDAKRAIDIGADAVWVSNHGGRQLDTSVPTIDLLPELVDAVGGRAEIIADGGVRRGSHVAKLLMLGATGVALGRASLYGLGAGGEDGVRRALTILEEELVRTMSLLGATKVSELDPELMRAPTR
ncbi:alpha-hydroxy acid oxidase [Henriciella pelagia]|jgi:L-lactate dehydrogenase (cytochrome)|uniref:Alpha-hydroxy-acid oxidizing enzyme n=1 Tax=Henriciella pelagia TaxID=1977912 RepID=A0ABQ1JG95_9PROT|nr:alpha-hydroxy acid oxidase [Henriciella pelagia]GGB66453.1 alpha-hydroxy-acid oxidizing enzyme [Henriciella pelagia]